MDALNQTIQDIRRYIFNLQVAEQSRELETVLEDLVQDLRLDTMLEVDLEVVGQRCCWLDTDQVAHATQIAREALSNVVQHAAATHVVVNLSYQGTSTQLTVIDDGRGITPGQQHNSRYQGQGTANMQERADLLGGDLTLEGEPGKGTRLVLTIPCDGCEGAMPKGGEEQETWA
jgi:signal transduction histidine kinase